MKLDHSSIAKCFFIIFFLTWLDNFDNRLKLCNLTLFGHIYLKLVYLSS